MALTGKVRLFCVPHSKLHFHIPAFSDVPTSSWAKASCAERSWLSSVPTADACSRLTTISFSSPVSHA